MRTTRTTLTCLIALLTVANAMASGPLGVYAVIDKVIFEPNEAAPVRLQIWGAFTYTDTNSGGTLPAQKGYMYFKLPSVDEGGTAAVITAVKKEWSDLKSVAGTGQAVAFGGWRYTGNLNSGHYYLRATPTWTDLLIHPESAKNAQLATYSTNVGVVKLSAAGHASIIDALKKALNP